MAHSLAVLDWTADRLAVWSAASSGGVVPVALDAGSVELPLAVSFAERKPQLGKAGLKLCQKAPELAFTNFLPWIGSNRRWRYRRHRPDTHTLFNWFIARAYEKLGKAVVVSLVPSYLSAEQITLLETYLRSGGLKPLASIRRSSAYTAGQMAEVGDSLFVDIDSHACTFTSLTYDGQGYRPRQSNIVHGFSLEAWREAILNLVVWRCLRVDRRDPRARPDDDQMMFDQFPQLLDDLSQSRTGQVVVEASDRPLEFSITPGQGEAACRTLCVRLAQAAQNYSSDVCVIPSEVAKLPGLFGTLGEAGLRTNRGSAESAATAALLWGKRILAGQRAHSGPDAPIPLAVEPRDAEPTTLPFPRKTAR